MKTATARVASTRATALRVGAWAHARPRILQVVPGAASNHAHASEVFLGAGSSALLLVGSPMVGTTEAVLNGLQQRRVLVAPGVGEFAVSGAAVTLGSTRLAGDWVLVRYETAVPSVHDHVISEAPTGSGATWTLAQTPAVGTERVIVNGLEYRRVTAGPGVGEYSISGAVVTLGLPLTGADRIWADYQT